MKLQSFLINSGESSEGPLYVDTLDNLSSNHAYSISHSKLQELNLYQAIAPRQLLLSSEGEYMISMTTTIAITNAGSLTPFTSQQCHASRTITAHKTVAVKMALHCLCTLKNLAF